MGSILRCYHGNRLHCQLSVKTTRQVCVNQENSQPCSQASPPFLFCSPQYGPNTHWSSREVRILVVETINEPHLHLQNSPGCYAKSPTVLANTRLHQRSCAGVTEWECFKGIIRTTVKGGAHMQLCKLMNTWYVYTARMSPTPNRGSALEHSKVIEPHNRIVFNFNLGLPHTYAHSTLQFTASAKNITNASQQSEKIVGGTEIQSCATF